MNYIDYDAQRKALESAQKDVQEFIRKNICTGKPDKKVDIES